MANSGNTQFGKGSLIRRFTYNYNAILFLLACSLLIHSCESIAAKEDRNFYYLSLFGSYFPIPARYFVAVEPGSYDSSEVLVLKSPIRLRDVAELEEGDLLEEASRSLGRISVGLLSKDAVVANEERNKLVVIETIQLPGISIRRSKGTLLSGDVISETFESVVVYDETHFLNIMDEDSELWKVLVRRFMEIKGVSVDDLGF